VVDRDPRRAAEVAAEFSVPAFSAHSELPRDVRAVTVAVPTEAHREVALGCIERGWDLMVEKPLAPTPDEGREMVAAARSRGVLLQVGHTERYNPAIRCAFPRIQAPRFIEAHRLGTFPGRSLDVDVILDLMIHDLDLALSLDRSGVQSVRAVGVNALTDKMDIANARIRFQSGCVANLTASRISVERTRKIRIFQPDSYLSIDTAAQEVVHYRLDRATGDRPRIEPVPSAVERDEPLRVELASFAEAVRGRRPPVVTGEDGLAALELAQRVQRAIQDGGS
jgi:predicted dehydrogenase